MSDEGLEIVGAPPRIEASLCDELLCEQYWHGGRLVDAANVIYLRSGVVWHRLTFDAGVIYWRQQADRPKAYTMPELNAETQLDDLGQRVGIAGRRVVSYVARAIAGGSEVEFQFEGGHSVVFRNECDHTSIIT